MEVPWRVAQAEGPQVEALSAGAARLDFDALFAQLGPCGGVLDFLDPVALLVPEVAAGGVGRGGDAACSAWGERAACGARVWAPSCAAPGALKAEAYDAGAKRGTKRLQAQPHVVQTTRPAKQPRPPSAAASRDASPTASDGTAPQLPPPLPCTPSEPCVATLLASAVSPAAAAYVGRLHVPGMLAAARAEPHAPLATFNVRSMRALMSVSSRMGAVAAAHAAELRCAAAALRSQGDSDAPAWLLGRRAPPHAEAALHVVHQHVHALTATLEDSLSPQHGYVAVLRRPLSAPERAQVADFTYMLSALHTFVAAAQSVLAQLRCRRGGAAAYLDASAGVLDLIGAILGASHDTYGQRIDEFGARAAANEVWPSPYLRHAAAAGCTF